MTLWIGLWALGCQDGGTISTGPTVEDSSSTDTSPSTGSPDTEPPTDTEPPPESLRFAPVDFPLTDEERRTVRASETAWVDEVEVPLDYQVLLRTGASPGGADTYGLLVDHTGQGLTNRDGTLDVSASVDASTLLQTESGAMVAITHIEDNPGALYRTALSQDPETGALTATGTEALDLSDLGALHHPCAASLTPWGTHLGGEEYPPDARRFGEAAEWGDLDLSVRRLIRYWGYDIYTDEDEDGTPDRVTLADVQRHLVPYRYGFPFEVSVTDGGTEVVRHRSMGRTSLELALVLPDQRTAYLTDDETNGGLYLYVADTAGDLSAGTLYGMAWSQTSDEGAGEADLGWISLGHATDAAIDAQVEAGVAFTDLFDTADPLRDEQGLPLGACPEDFDPVNTHAGFECLALRDGMATTASRLETDRYAALLGATMELRKGEGITHDPDRSRLYFAISEVTRGMESQADGGYDLGGPDHIRLQPNPCGVVYALDLAPDAAVGSDHVATRISGLLAGTPIQYGKKDPYAGNRCDITGIASPDNLHVLPHQGVLLVAEDTSEQVVDSVWAHDLRDQTLTRIFTAPYGAETSGVYGYRLGDWSYVRIMVHDPFTGLGVPEPKSPDELAGWDGVLGPLPPLGP